MTYALGQAKWIPGQISFATTRTGRLPSVQPLIEAGLPYAPFIEHGSFVTGQPDIARYGRDPYRGLMGIDMTPRQERHSTFEVRVRGLRCSEPQWRGRGLRRARRAALRLAGRHRSDAVIYLSGGVPTKVDTVYFGRPVSMSGLGDDPFDVACRASGGTPTTRGSTKVCEGGSIDRVTTAAEEGVKSVAKVGTMIAVGAGVGLAAGITGGLLKKATWGGLLGGVGGGILGYLFYRQMGDL